NNVIPFPKPADTSVRYNDQIGLSDDHAAEHAAEAAIETGQIADEKEQPALAETPIEEPVEGPAEVLEEAAFADELFVPATEPEQAAIATEEAAFEEQPAFAPGEEPDEEIAEIFVEEAGEVLDTIDEYLPQWRDYPADAESLAVIRRAFHTLKGSGRMVGATHIGELAWSVENMLNRVIDGTVHLDAQRVDAVTSARALVPDMIAAFERRVIPDMRKAQPLIERVQLLAREQNPTFPEAAAPSAPEPEPVVATSTLIEPAPIDSFDATDTTDIPTLSFIEDP